MSESGPSPENALTPEEQAALRDAEAFDQAFDMMHKSEIDKVQRRHPSSRQRPPQTDPDEPESEA